MTTPPAIFEYLIHLLEVSVVIGIAVIIYITKKHSPRLNKKIDQEMKKYEDYH